MGEKSKISLRTIGIDKLILIVIAGIVLILTSVGDIGDNEGSTEAYTQENDAQNIQVISDEEELADILENIAGVGKVKVMITYKSTEEKVLQEDKTSDSSSTDEEDSEGGKRTITESNSSYTTIYTTDGDGNEVPYVIKTFLPEVEGVAVVAEGGSNVGVKEEIIGVVQALFSIESHKIWVTEMN